jgi:hypothetical protein
VRDKIEYADQVIADFAKEKIRSGDVVVTYARSATFHLSVERKLMLQTGRRLSRGSYWKLGER